jgi:hypothetical protein
MFYYTFIALKKYSIMWSGVALLLFFMLRDRFKAREALSFTCATARDKDSGSQKRCDAARNKISGSQKRCATLRKQKTK